MDDRTDEVTALRAKVEALEKEREELIGRLTVAEHQLFELQAERNGIEVRRRENAENPDWQPEANSI